ncbi:MAG: hypothetical protein IJ231_11325 [Clostridia bacterium]|nr:hypothetical protein [Clostridia bacterium]
MSHLLDVYGISKSHEIVSYKTSIYDLYDRMFKDSDPEMLDLLQVLKEYEQDEEIKKLFEVHYSDIILIFDMDPQAPLFTPEKISNMTEYFCESTENGKLYLNYPMVEAFYHMKSIPDPQYDEYIVSERELRNKGEFKRRVKRVNRSPYKKFAQTKEACDAVIEQNLRKAQKISGQEEKGTGLSMEKVLETQLQYYLKDHLIFVLCTCIFYILDFNPGFVFFSEGQSSGADGAAMNNRRVT